MNKPIKICFVSLYAYHLFNPGNKSKFGGAELQLYLLATKLAADPSFEIHFIVGDFGQPEYELRNGVHLYKVFDTSRGFKHMRAILGFPRLWRLLNKINPDVCIQRAAGLETAEVGLYCGLTHRHFIYMVAHDSDVNQKKAYWHRGIVGTLRWWLFRLGFKSADIVFTQHEGQQRIVKELYKKQSFVRLSAHTIPQSIDVDGKNIVLWVARCEDWKDPEKFLELAKFFQDQKFVMVMPESNDKEFYEQITSEATGIANLELVGFVPFDKIDNYFADAKIFVNTSKTEGFPNTFIQAAKTKTPVVSLNVDPNGMLGKNQMGICAGSDFEKLKSALGQLLQNEQLRRQMGENAYNYASEYHNIDKIAENDKLIIKKLVNAV